MRLRILALALGVIACNRSASTPAPAPDAAARASPRIQPPTWPKPPLASAAWDASKSGLPPAIVDAARVLFAQGLGDPRGCAYRAIEVEVGDTWSGGGEIGKAHGFVFPSSNGELYAVGWNGGVYRVVGAGDEVDLEADVRLALGPNSKDALAGKESIEGGSLSAIATPIMAILLLRLGRESLASSVWSAQKEIDAKASHDPKSAYVDLARTWLTPLHERALSAHMRKSDGVALEMVRQLTLVHPLVEQEARRRGAGDENTSVISFLDGLSSLAVDQERRALGPTRGVRGDRVSELVAKLEDVSARQEGHPGDVRLLSDPIVSELVALGTDAVPALITAVESDERLTRSVHSWRTFDPHRTVLGVHEAAYAAIGAIFDVSFFDPVSSGDNLTVRGPAGRKKLAAAIRKHWERWKDTPIVEQWFGMFADDAATPERWLEVSERIVQPSNEISHPSSMLLAMPSTLRGAPSTMRGESLRARSSPSVSDLFERRIASLELGKACAMSHLFAAWEPARAVPTLARQVDAAIKASAGTPGHLGHVRCIAALTADRVAAGDASALGEYATWIERTTPAESIDGLFAPMIRWPHDPEIVRASAKLFAPSSPWVPFVAVEDKGVWHSAPWPTMLGLCKSDMIKVEAYRAHLLSGLVDMRRFALGAVEGRWIKITQGSSNTSQEARPEVTLPPSGTRFVVRVADQYAEAIASRPDAPRYALFWPERERAAALTRMRAYVSAIR